MSVACAEQPGAVTGAAKTGPLHLRITLWLIGTRRTAKPSPSDGRPGSVGGAGVEAAVDGDAVAAAQFGGGEDERAGQDITPGVGDHQFASFNAVFGRAGVDLDGATELTTVTEGVGAGSGRAGVVAGHINECGAQATGGNSIVAWEEIDDLGDVGYPIIEAYEDGTFVVTKHDGTGGRVSRAVVAEQILYEMGDPTEYITPDVVADFTTIQLHDEGDNRVRVHGVRGGPRTDKLKVSISYSAGWKAAGTLVYGWPDPVKKAEYAARILRERLDRMGAKFDSVRVEYVGWNACHGPLAGPPPADLPEVELRVAVRSQDREAVEMFSRELAPLILTGPPTVTGFAGGRPRVQEMVAYWPALIDRTVIEPNLRVDVQEA